MPSKTREAFVLIDGDEIKRIYENELGGITIHIKVLHSRIEVDVLTGEDEEVNHLGVADIG
jgi:hypothetical protein